MREGSVLDFKDRNVLLIAFTNLKIDARVRREIEIFKKLGFGSISVICSEPDRIDGVEISELKYGLKPFREKFFHFLTGSFIEKDGNFLDLQDYRGKDIELLNSLSKRKIDLIFAADFSALPFALRLKKMLKNKPPLIYDAHEFAPGVKSGFKWSLTRKRYYHALLKYAFSEVSASIFVSGMMGKLHEKLYGVKNYYIVPNLPHYFDLVPKKPSEDEIHLVHHGGAIRNRGLEMIIDLMGLLDERFKLHFHLVTAGNRSQEYLEELKSRAEKLAPDRIYFHDPISPPEKIPEALNQYDIGAFLVSRATKNFEIAFPNKLADFFQARLMCLFTPAFKEANRIIKEFDCGIVLSGSDIMEAAKILTSLRTDEIYKYKLNADRAAKVLNSERSEEVLVRAISDVLNR